MVSKRLHFFLLNSFCSHCYIVWLCSFSNTKVRAAFRATKTQQLVITTRIFPWVFLLKTESSTHNTESFWSVRPSDIYSLTFEITQVAVRLPLYVQRRNSRGFQSRGPAGLPSRFPFQICVCNHKKDQPQIRIAFLGFSPQNRRSIFWFNVLLLAISKNSECTRECKLLWFARGDYKKFAVVIILTLL